jgi:hypothetical protein
MQFCKGSTTITIKISLEPSPILITQLSWPTDVIMHLIQVHQRFLKEDLEGKSEMLIEIEKKLYKKSTIGQGGIKEGRKKE